LRPVADVASDLGISANDIEPYGRDKAKIPLDSFPSLGANGTPGKLIVVTAITPTPAGEGKSTTAVGLVQGLAKIGKRPALTIRQPSLGPVFGQKGGGTGGGRSTVQPAEEINLHLTGDFHAMMSAHNLLAAMTDNVVYRHQIDGFEADGITWRRVTDAEDRALRNATLGLNGDGPMRQTGYDISAASEIMAILALADGYKGLRERLGQIVVGWTRDRTPISAEQIGAVGSMMALLRDALKPNLCQTLEGQPALVHMGPFGNIAHGCSSILADQLAVASAEYVVTEAGFGADLGFEKFMDIKVRQGGPKPDAAVVVCTIRGLKYHGGVDLKDLSTPNADAVKIGTDNLRNALRITTMFGLNAVVAINRFPEDTQDELKAVKTAALDAGAKAVAEANGFAEGGDGMRELAEAVVAVADAGSDVSLLYDDEDSTIDKVEMMADRLYGADRVLWGRMTRTTARRFEANGWKFPICMAKTHLSVSADARLRNVPTGHVLPIQELRISAGARQIVTLAGEIMTLPGLPSKPNAFDIDLNDDGQIVGVLGT
jgi:formate--tetrahydrofolate ligase